MYLLHNIFISLGDKTKLLENIENGAAYNKLKEMVENQCGDISYLEDTTKFEKSKYISAVVSEKTGKVKEINAEEYFNKNRVHRKKYQ